LPSRPLVRATMARSRREFELKFNCTRRKGACGWGGGGEEEEEERESTWPQKLLMLQRADHNHNHNHNNARDREACACPATPAMPGREGDVDMWDVRGGGGG
jgi:hypothetical protein